MGIKKYFDYIKNGFLYAGVSREEFHSIREKVRLTNFHVWRILSFAEAVMFFICFMTCFHNESVQANQAVYLGMLIASVMIFFVFLLFGKKMPKLAVDILTYISISLLMLYGLAVGTLSDQDLPGITFMVMLVIAPMLIVGRPWISTILVLFFMSTYLVIVERVKTGTSLRLDVYNAILFSVVSILLHFFTSISKMRGLLSDAKLEHLATYDGLTGLENELSYVMEVEKINNAIQDGTQKNFAVMMCDVNGVKPTNDTYGHRFGCALIVEGGHYLASLFQNSRLFHVGGDEYVVILQGEDYEKRESLMTQFETKMDDYFINKDGIRLRVSVAFGLASYDEGEDQKFASVMQRADKAMYEKKKEMKAKYHIASRKE